MKKKTNIGKPLKFHCFLRIHTQEHRAHLCICVLYSNIYRLHLFCLLSINVRIHKNERTKKKKITITNFNDSFRQIFRTTKNKIEHEVNSFVLFYFILLHNFFRIKTIFYFEWIVVFFLVCVFIVFSFSFFFKRHEWSQYNNRSKAQQRRTVWYNIRITTNDSSELW